MERPTFHTSGQVTTLAADWSISLFCVRFSIRAGFVTDGASVPALLQRWAGRPFDWPRIAAALVHDWLYASHVVARWLADLIFLLLLIRVGYPVWRSITDWWAVRRFGETAYYGHGLEDQCFARTHGSISLCLKTPKKGKPNE